MFLHAGVVHFLFNMIGFLQVGAMVERNFGWWRVRTKKKTDTTVGSRLVARVHSCARHVQTLLCFQRVYIRALLSVEVKNSFVYYYCCCT